MITSAAQHLWQPSFPTLSSRKGRLNAPAHASARSPRWLFGSVRWGARATLLANLPSDIVGMAFFAYGAYLLPRHKDIDAVDSRHGTNLVPAAGRFRIADRIAELIPGNSGKIQVAPDRMSFRRIATLFLDFHDERSGRPLHTLSP